MSRHSRIRIPPTPSIQQQHGHLSLIRKFTARAYAAVCTVHTQPLQPHPPDDESRPPLRLRRVPLSAMCEKSSAKDGMHTRPELQMQYINYSSRRSSGTGDEPNNTPMVSQIHCDTSCRIHATPHPAPLEYMQNYLPRASKRRAICNRCQAMHLWFSNPLFR